MLVFIVSTLTAIVVSFLCSLAEAALLSLNPIRLETLKQQGHTFASLWIDLRKNIGRPIAAILILNTIAHTGGATIAGGAFDEIYGDEWLWLFSVVFTIVILFGTEILPKVIGVAYNERLAPWIAPGLRLSIGALRPVIFLTELISKALRKKDEAPSFSRADLETLARVARMHNVIEVEQENVILNAAKLRETKVQSIMIPREWIIYLRMALPPEANFEIARNNFHTRYPISENDSVDGITGYVNFKEMIASAQNLREFKLSEIARSILTVNPEANLNTMLKLFIGHRHHLAVVKDREGKIIGMVTLEDVIEEIVGEIEDEFDASPAEIIQISPNSWKVGGGARLEKLKEKIPALEIDAPSELLFQWLQSRIKTAPHPGFSFSVGTIKFTVQQIRRGKAHEVKIETDAHLQKGV
jgi:CBS domain containing-hemolysin-like protein